MNDDKKQLGSVEVSLIDSVAKAEIKDFAADIGEIALDSLLDEGLIKEIPVVGALVRLLRAGVSVRDRLFLRKVVSFLAEFDGVDPTKRLEFAARLDADEGTRARCGVARRCHQSDRVG